jgi:glucose uptake protein GlcU
MTGMNATILSVLMLAGIALGIGGIYLITRRRDYKRGWLMIVAGVVMFLNVAIWTLPLD